MWDGKLGRGAAAWGQGCPDAGAGNIEYGKGGPYIGRCPDAGETGPHKGPCRSPHRQFPDVGRETFQMWNGKPQAGALPHGGEAARMRAQETLSMGRAGLTSADARTRAKLGRIKARAEARTGRCRMWGGKPCRPFKASAFGD